MASKGKFIKDSALTKEQKKLLKGMSKSSRKALEKLTPLDKIPLASKTDLYGKARGVLSDLLSPDSQAYEKFKAPYMQQFEREVLPGIAERFGGIGASRSSALQNVLAGAGSDLTTSLAQLKTGLMGSAIPMAMNLAQMPMDEQMALRQSAMGMAQPALGTRAYNTMYQPPVMKASDYLGGSGGGGGQGFWGSMLPGVGAGLGTAAGSAFGGPIGGAIGSGIGGLIGKIPSLFS